MARRPTRTLTEVELEFMQVVWELDEVTTEDVLEYLRRRGRELADGSVRKILSILMAKGYITRRFEGRGFRYKAVMAKEKADKSLLSDLVERAFRGSAALMVASLLNSRKISKQELKQIKRLITEREKQQ